jgi:pseudouridylate synthase
VDYRLDTPTEIAALLKAKWAIDLRGGVLVANPVPAEFAQDQGTMERAIEQALRLAEQQGVKGKAVTPFLLAQVEQFTGGSSLATNIELVCHNARLAGEVSGALVGLND